MIGPRASQRALLLWLLAVAAITTLPWSNFQGHAHWAQVNWRPFLSRYDNLRDIALNFALFVPGGWLIVAARPGPRHRALWLAAGLAAFVSAGAELYQVFCHNRLASATDFTVNVAGAVFGAWLARARGKRED